MNKVCKIRFYPNQTQINIIYKTFGACRYVKNLYIEYNNELYKNGQGFLSGYDFAKIITKLKKQEEKYYWLNDISTKALKDAIMTQEKSYKNFFRKIKSKEKTSSPRFKSRKRMRHESFFFIKDNIRFDTGKKNIIKIPILGNIRITERDYLPDIKTITSGRVIRQDNKFYVMFIYKMDIKHEKKNNIGYGIDVGIKNYITLSDSNGNNFCFKHFKEQKNYMDITNQIEYIQKVISKKAEINYGRLLNIYFDKYHNLDNLSDKEKNIMKGESYNTSNIKKLQDKLRKLNSKKNNIRRDYINKLVYGLVVRTKPLFITIEDLSISNMLTNDSSSTLHRYISDSGFYYFRTYLNQKCKEYDTELRIANKYFASSKKCSRCGNKKSDLKLSDRVYICDSCGLIIDRDINASINLLNLNKYQIII